jgi:transcriptional regulator with XRE-family HTH domain
VEAKGLKISECLRNSQINESYGYQLFNGKRQPSRSKVIQLALGLSLTLEETNRLLKLAEKSELYVKDQRDAVVMFALNKKWTLYDTEALLIERGLESIIKNKD